MSLTAPQHHRKISAFTLVELLIVMAIIGVLAALTLGVSKGVMERAARSRATAEIAAISTALERFKSDNGAYPLQFDAVSFGPYPDGTAPDPSSYKAASQALFTNLAGRVDYTAAVNNGSTAYIEFKKNQVSTSLSPSYIIDPWRYSYGYFITTNTTSTVAQNGANFFDLWSTGGKTKNTSEGETNSWITNWRPN